MSDALYDELDRIFHPGSMASVGVTDKMANMGMAFLDGFTRQGFKGRLYAINPNRKVDKYESYASVADIPDRLDYAKICVKSHLVPDIIRDCVKKGVRCATIFSSGFRESGTKEGIKLEEEIISIARGTGLRLIGPNCMGIHYPDFGLAIRQDMPLGLRGGNISVAAQSGGIAISTTMALAERLVPVRKAVSYGNEIDLGAPEFLYYFARDPETKVICLYIEGTRRPDELKKAVFDAAARKPLVILKGGITDTGSRAVSSHTGAMSGAAVIWESLARQAGAALVSDFDELVDMSLLFSLSGPPAGKRIGLLTISGGFGVYATDQVAKAGFELPELTSKTKTGMEKFIDSAGTSVKNPVDMAAKFFQPAFFKDMFSTLNADDNIDCFIMIYSMEYLAWLTGQEKAISEFLVTNIIQNLKEFTKPLYIVFLHTICEDLRLVHERSFIAAGYPVFPTVQRCLDSLKRSMNYRKNR